MFSGSTAVKNQSVKFQMSSKNSNSPFPSQGKLIYSTLWKMQPNDLDQYRYRVDFIFIILKNFKGEIIRAFCHSFIIHEEKVNIQAFREGMMIFPGNTADHPESAPFPNFPLQPTHQNHLGVLQQKYPTLSVRIFGDVALASIF